MNRPSSIAAAAVTCLSFLLAGCGAGIVPGSKATPTPAPGTPLISLSPTSVAFANTVVGSTSASASVTVSNVGSAPLVFSSITLADTTNFALNNGCPTSLAAQASCTLSLTFKPTSSTGSLNGTSFASSVTLTDNSNNVSNAQQTVSLAGLGTTAPTLAPQVTLTPTSLTFAATAVGATSASQTITVLNSGNAVLNIADISLADLQDYSLTSTCGTTLAAAATCTLTVTFHPSVTGTLTDNVTLTDNANNVTGAQQAVPLSGVGSAAAVPIASVSPTTLTFPDTNVNSTSAAMSFRLTNTGTANLIVSSLGGVSSVFALSGPSCNTGTYSSIAPGSYCDFTFTFAPTAAGANTFTYVLTDNSNGVTGSTQSVLLTGNGLAASNSSVTLAPDPLAFPNTELNSSSSPLTATLTNGGSTTLTGITASITGGATSAAFTITGTTCGATLAPAGTCTISVTFKPFIVGTFLAYLSVADSATNSPQVISLTGTSIAAALTLSPTSITFQTTKVGNTATATSTLTNTGGATANLTGLTYTGDSAFVETNTCGATLAGGASCVITVVFTPTNPISYTGTVTITSSNATPSPLTLPITGAGTNSAVTYKLYELPDPGAGQPGSGLLTAVYGLIDSAQSTINMTMYALNDNGTGGATQKLVAACARGVTVRVILDTNSEKSQDTPAYNAINAGGSNCHAVWANSAFGVTHQKSIEVDHTTMALMSLNLQSQYYSTTRDFAMVYNDPADIAAVEDVFEHDYAVAGTKSTTEQAYVAGLGNDLIWSPELPSTTPTNNAKTKMEAVINGATTTLNVEAEEMTSTVSYIVTDIINACKRGVLVKVLIENQSGSYSAQLNQLKAGGCTNIRIYSSSTGFYIHAKDVVADYGLPTQAVYMGSINYSNASMTSNRELGMNISDPASVALLYNTFNTDYAGAATF